MIYVTDNYGVFQIRNGVPAAARNSANCDMYHELFSLRLQKRIQVTVRWMPSHQTNLTEIPTELNITELDLKANRLADLLAGKAAARHQLPKPVVRNYLYYPELVRKIQKRLAVLLLNLPPRETHTNKKQKPDAPRQSLDDLLANTAHTLSITGPRLQCTKCLNSFKLASTSCKNWLNTQCVQTPQPSSTESVKPIKLDGTVHLKCRAVAILST